MIFLTYVIIVLVLFLMWFRSMTTPPMERMNMSRMKLKRIKCPVCRKKVRIGKTDIMKGANGCDHSGLCGLVSLDPRLKKELPEESPLEDGEYEYDAPEPLVLHIQDANNKFTNE